MASVTADLMRRAGPLLGVAQHAAATEPLVLSSTDRTRPSPRAARGVSVLRFVYKT